MGVDLDINKLTYALGSDTRRKILFLLSQGADYALSLATKLNLTPRAVIQNLNILEETGLVEKIVKKSPYGPSRVYYKIKRGVHLNISLSPRCFRIKMAELPDKIEFQQDYLKEALEEVDKLEFFKQDSEALQKIIELLNKTESKLRELEETQCNLLKLRDKIFEEIEKILPPEPSEISLATLIRSLIELGGEGDILDLLEYHKTSKNRLEELLDLAKKYNLIKEKKVKEEKDYYTL
ncbi:MAG: ArsR family transcriptional regulator [Candidatus Odinarchaeum yellowstonii]|uniref:ArsR family transcriptional regulator n=1 Tax=Odinarchaeota yellowstonii (strain LCB_4) TaxID=1841599 RepID=A0AAF0IBF0_ODILC|nr:MAG: ArsR family transcriptional regulator [Candidatus Odinarchaeum yellowstonii]